MSSLFPFIGKILACFDPDPDPLSYKNSVIPDPDPKHWVHARAVSFVKICVVPSSVPNLGHFDTDPDRHPWIHTLDYRSGFCSFGQRLWRCQQKNKFFQVLLFFYLKGPKHDQVECGFFYRNQTRMVRWLGDWQKKLISFMIGADIRHFVFLAKAEHTLKIM
jgi:hypothetical protein